MSDTGPPTTRRVVLIVDGQRFDKWTSVKIIRALKEVCGSFELEYVDEGRLAEALTTLISPPPYFRVLRAGQKCELRIDDEPVLVGYIVHVKGQQSPGKITSSISGKDVCGDLVDCAAAPNGPAEWKNIKLDAFARLITKPFGIGVSVQTNVGAPFPVHAISPHDKAMPAIEKAARQRAVLLTSDGVGNLVLTTAGSTRAPAPIAVGVNVIEAGFEDNWEHRFSDVYVKGQTPGANGNHAGKPCVLSPTTAPTGSGTGPDPYATVVEKAGIVMTGHANDPEINRWRPDVRMVNTQSGSSTVQVQAEWHVRVDRGQAQKNTYSVQDWRDGPDNALWRPNQLTAVYDPFAELDDDMLIETVEYQFDDQGSRTVLHVTGPSAYDRINEPARSRPRHRGRRGA